MPAAVAVPLGVAALGAASKYGAATSGSKAAREAAAAQERSTAAALEYQKSRDAMADSRYDKKFALYQEAVNDWRKRNGGGAAPVGPVATGGGGGGAVPVSIADLVGAQQNVADAQAPQAAPGSIAATVGGWNDWQRYGA